MKVDLSGKTALVTGSTGGIGFAIAQGLAESGAEVVINGRGEARVQAAIGRLGDAVPGARLRGIAADVGAAGGVAALTAAFPELDILVNNAAVFAPADFFAIPDAEWLRFFEVNVLSGVRLARAYLRGMIARDWGRVVFISSESAVNIPPDMIHYGMSKTAQLAVSRGLAELTAGTGVTVNAVLPGPTRSEGAEQFLAATAAQTGQTPAQVAASFIAEHRPSSILRRFTSVTEVANMVLYTCSTEASATNGAALRVDGGVVRSIL